MSLSELLLTPETRQRHKATWWVYAGRERIRRTSQMRGTWGHDVTCSCGWDSKTGGATKRSVERALFEHRWDEQMNCDAKKRPCRDCNAQAGQPCTGNGAWGTEVLDYLHPARWEDDLAEVAER